MFQHRVEAFFTEYLLSDAHPLGAITDYVIKKWIPDEKITSCPLLAVGKRCPKIDKDPDDVVCAFIDKYITAVIPSVAPENEHDIKLMDNLQKHTHSDYCHRNQFLLFQFSETPCNKNLNILTTCWWSW